ncbi:MAG TPA: hypothetical protein VGG96_01190, partial [Steroidobacteraceae bacterium]
MKIVRHTAPDMRQAMRLVREQLGEDAVILSSRRTPQGVEITAAVDFDASSLEARAAAAAAAAAPAPAPTPAPAAVVPAVALATAAATLPAAAAAAALPPVTPEALFPPQADIPADAMGRE